MKKRVATSLPPGSFPVAPLERRPGSGGWGGFPMIGSKRRIRLFVLLCLALGLASLVPLLVSDGVLIRRNRRTLETLEEKYLTRSSSALADHVGAFYASAREGLKGASDSLRLAGQISGRDPFT